MTRTERRALERKGIKEANRIAKRAGIDCVLKSTIHPELDPAGRRQLVGVCRKLPRAVPRSCSRNPSTPAQHSANQQNAQQSTGPRTVEGKAKSSCNSSTHGLSGTQIRDVALRKRRKNTIELEAGLMAEHRATTLTETLLVRKMAQSWWLRERAQFFIDALSAR